MKSIEFTRQAIRNTIENTSSISIKTAVLFLLGIVGIATIAILTETHLYLLGVIIALPFLFVFFRYPHIWLYSVAIVMYSWFYGFGSSDGVSALEVIEVALLFGGVLAWIFYMAVIRKQKIIINVGESLLVGIFVFSSIHIVISLVNGVPLLDSMREYLLFISLLYVFPIRFYLSDKHKMITFTVILSLVILSLGIGNLFKLKSALNNLTYAFEIMAGRSSVCESIYVFISILMIVISLNVRKWYWKVSFIMLTMLSFALLFSTFSRGFWIGFMLGIVLLFIRVSMAQKKKIAIYMSLIALVSGLLISTFGGNKGKIAVKFIETRLFAVKKGVGEESLKARFVESKIVFHSIENNLLAGEGIGAQYVNYDPFDFTAFRTKFIHNGYIFTFFKYGIPFGLLFYAVYGYFFIVGWSLFKKVDGFNLILLSIAFPLLVAILVVNNTSSQVETRDGLFFTALSFAIISIVKERQRLKILENEKIHILTLDN